jgi:hypothetical protein
MPTGVPRLNRRRYREIVAALKELISNKKAPPQRRLHAIETLMEVYARHDRTIAQYEARRRAAEASQNDSQPSEVPEAPLSPEDALKEAHSFLARIGAKGVVDGIE